MLRRVMASLAMIVLAVGLGVRADDSAKKPEDISSLQDDVKLKQIALENRFQKLTVQLRVVAERLARSTDKKDREKAQQIQDALKLANEAGIGNKFKTLIENLGKKDAKTGKPSIDDIDSALDESTQVLAAMEAMLQLLMSEGKDAERKAEIERLTNILKELNKVIRDQKIVRNKTEKGSMNPDDLKKAQGDVKKATENISGQVGGDPKAGKDNKGTEAKATNKENKDGKGGEGANKKDNKDGQGKEGASKDSKDGKPSEGSGKPKDGGKDSKGNEGAKKDSKDNPQGKEGDKKDNKDGQGKEGSSKDSKDGKPSEGSGKPKDGKDGKPSDSKGKPSNSPPSQGQGKPGDGGDSSSKPKPMPNQKPQPTPLPGKKNIEEAIGRQDSAEKKLPDKKASDDQDDAIQELEKARAELEKLLKQKREEEMDALLAQLEARCKYMLQLQKEVYEATLSIDKAIASNPDKQPSKVEHVKSQQQAEKEGEIVKEAKRAIGLLEADNTAVAFTEVFRQLKEDMELVQNRLGKTDVGDFTQRTELDIIQTLGDMIKALEKARKDLQNQQSPPGQGGQQGQPPPKDLLDKIAELKLIKLRQIIVNNRTTAYAKNYTGEQAEAKDIKDELKKLGKDQDKLKKMIVDMATKKNE